MTDSIIILGPQGCGKTLNAAAIAQVFGFTKWRDADSGPMPKTGHLILANALPENCGLRVVSFRDAMKKIAKPHPATPCHD